MMIRRIWSRAGFPVRFFSSVSGFALIVAGCGCTAETNPDWVSAQWTQAMQTYHIEPVYPPTEDIHVGDIFGVPVDAGDVAPHTNLLGSAIKLAFIPTRKLLEDYYSQVPVFPSTSDPPLQGKIWLQQPATVTAAQANAAHAAGQPQSVFAEVNTLTELPLMAFPGFTIANANAESINASIPLRFFDFLFGAARTHEDAVVIKIPAAETYGIPSTTAEAALVGYCLGRYTGIACRSDVVRRELTSIIGYTPQNAALYFVNRLYLTRSIEYTYDASTAIGAQGKFLVELKTALANQQNLLNALKVSSPTNPANPNLSSTNQSSPTTSQPQSDADVVKSASDATKSAAQATKTLADALNVAMKSNTISASTTSHPTDVSNPSNPSRPPSNPSNPSNASTPSSPSNPTNASIPSHATSASGPSNPSNVTNPSTASSPSGPASDQNATTEVAALTKSLNDFLAAIQSSNSQLGSSPVPGGTFSIGAISEQGITLVQTFERPIAIGYHAIKISTYESEK